jgi:hypothetical protein
VTRAPIHNTRSNIMLPGRGVAALWQAVGMLGMQWGWQNLQTMPGEATTATLGATCLQQGSGVGYRQP